MALEPEAASIYCQRESLEKLRINQDQSKLTKPNTRYLVADIGGICNYITVYSQKRNAKYILGIIILIKIKFYLYEFGKCRTRFLIKLVLSLIANYGDCPRLRATLNLLDLCDPHELIDTVCLDKHPI